MITFRRLITAYNHFNDDLSDPRSANYLLVNSPVSVAVIVISYLLFVTKYGPKFMEKRKPFNIHKGVIVYNLIQIIFCVYMTTSSIMSCYWPLRYNLLCQPVGSSTSPQDLHVVFLVWLYFLLKIIDLLDTVFIILRKKESQLSVLHIFHHAGMVLLAWVGVKFVPGGQSILIGTINCFVHSIMYAYYLTTIMDSKYRSPWWKKHLTQLQIGQFAVIALYLSLPVVFDCGYPKHISYFWLTMDIAVAMLFLNFYNKSYNLKNQKQK